MKGTDHGFEAKGKMSGDVLEEAPSHAVAEFANDALDVRPQVPLVVFSLALSGLTERLAGVSGKDGVDRSGEGYCVKGRDIIPDRGWSEVSGPLGGDKGFSRVFLPFDKASGVEGGFCEHKAHIKTTGSGAEGQSVSGR